MGFKERLEEYERQKNENLEREAKRQKEKLESLQKKSEVYDAHALFAAVLLADLIKNSKVEEAIKDCRDTIPTIQTSYSLETKYTRSVYDAHQGSLWKSQDYKSIDAILDAKTMLEKNRLRNEFDFLDLDNMTIVCKVIWYKTQDTQNLFELKVKKTKPLLGKVKITTTVIGENTQRLPDNSINDKSTLEKAFFEAYIKPNTVYIGRDNRSWLDDAKPLW